MLKLNLWLAFERHRRNLVCQIADQDEIARLPSLGNDEGEQTKHINIYMEVVMNHRRNFITPRRRTVTFSDTFTNSLKFAQCEARVLHIKGLLATGDPALNDPQQRFFSRRVERALDPKKLGAYLDRLLCEWGIHHLHLGESKRTDELLFAMIDGDTARFIAICSHDDIYSTDPLAIAHRNWPELFDVLHGISGDNLTPQQIKTLRQRNGNFVPVVNGVALAPREMITAAGGTAHVIQEVDWMHVALHELEAKLVSSLPDRNRIATAAGLAQDALTLEVVDDGDNFGNHILMRDVASKRLIRVAFKTLPNVTEE